MSQITIQCRLIASEATRFALWTLMAEKNTPLINELIEQVNQHTDFEKWKQKGKIPSSTVNQLCQSLRTDPNFAGQPARFYTSAANTVDYIYKSWLTLQKQLSSRIQRKTHWLEMLKSDQELVELSGCDLTTIHQAAAEMLAAATKNSPQEQPDQVGKKPKRTKKSRQPNDSGASRSTSSLLFEAYRDTKDIVPQCAICHLLKNSCRVSDREEDPDKFNKRRRKVEIQIQRLQDQLEGRLPKGRDLTGQSWLNTLDIATSTVPLDNAEAKRWQNRLLTKSASLPFPVSFETNEDMVWLSNQKERICVHFNGLGEHTFEVYCDQRQLHWFQRFWEDQQAKRASKNQHSSGLFTLRSARLGWQEDSGKGDPWDVHQLTLFCTIETRLWSTEGTEQVRHEKAAEVAQKITQMESKGNLVETQQAYVKRLNSTLSRISTPFHRPNKSLYQGQTHIIVGLSIGLEQPAAITIWDAKANQVTATYSIRQLLGKNYRLLDRRRSEQQKTAHQRHKAQKQSAPNQFGESELGQYVDRLLAKSIVTIAKNHQAGSIAVPKLGNLREIVEAEVRAKAEQKCSGYLEGQQKYAKQYRTSVHRWSYGRLIDSIRSQAIKIGIVIEEAKQPLTGRLEEKAELVAIAAYQARA